MKIKVGSKNTERENIKSNKMRSLYIIYLKKNQQKTEMIK